MVVLTKSDIRGVVKYLVDNFMDSRLEDSSATSIIGLELSKSDNTTSGYRTEDDRKNICKFTFSTNATSNAVGDHTLDDLIFRDGDDCKYGFGREYTHIKCTINELLTALCFVRKDAILEIRDYLYHKKDVSIDESYQNEVTKGNNMQRKTVNISLIDSTTDIKDCDALVVDLGTFVVNGTDESTIKVRILGNPDTNAKVIEALESHNTKRGSTINLGILERTGKKVKLLPILLEDLIWEIK